MNWTYGIRSVRVGHMDHAAALRGLYLPLLTPFAPDGSVAVDALEALAGHAFDAGAAGLVALGTTAETATLTDAERHRIVTVCARSCRDRGGQLIVGAGGNDTLRTADELSALAEWPEVTAALVPVPPFTRPSERGVLAHFERLAATSPVPLVTYHIPYRTGQALRADTLRRLGKLSGVVGVKHAVNGVDADTVDLLGDLPPDFAVLAGDDVFAGALLALGAAGGILASAHVCPERFVELVAAWQSGDVDRARNLGAALATLSGALFAEPNPTVVKGVLHAQGRIPTADVRLPLLPAAAASVEAALHALADIPAPRTAAEPVPV